MNKSMIERCFEKSEKVIQFRICDFELKNVFNFAKIKALYLMDKHPLEKYLEESDDDI